MCRYLSVPVKWLIIILSLLLSLFLSSLLLNSVPDSPFDGLDDETVGLIVVVGVAALLVAGLAYAARKWWLERRLARRLAVDDQANDQMVDDQLAMVAPMVPDSAV